VIPIKARFIFVLVMALILANFLSVGGGGRLLGFFGGDGN
jgi:hypothetical protein